MKQRRLKYALGMIIFVFLICLMPNYEMKANAAKEVPIDYTPISTVEDLNMININPHGKYMLTNDIDLSSVTEGNGWKPLKAFTGVLDGNGYKIRNMTFHGELSSDYYNEYGEAEIGFFKYVRGTVRNIAFTNVNIDISMKQDYSDNSHIGILCGSAGDGAANYPASIEQCYTTGSIKVKVNAFSKCFPSVGGLVGRLMDNGYISDCYTDVRIHVIDSYTEVSDGSKHGNVKFNVGGISAINWYDDNMCRNCYARGSITATADRVTLAMIADGAYNEPSQNCYYLSSSGGDEYATSLTENQMKIAIYYEGFDFENIWFLDANSFYPYPQLRSCMHN